MNGRIDVRIDFGLNFSSEKNVIHSGLADA